MTFDQAQELKNKIGETKVISEIKMKVYVTPSNRQDLLEYINHYKLNKISDDTSKLFSKDKEFLVHGLHDNGSDVIFRNIFE